VVTFTSDEVPPVTVEPPFNSVLFAALAEVLEAAIADICAVVRLLVVVPLLTVDEVPPVTVEPPFNSVLFAALAEVLEAAIADI
jgi:hypothetical protein